MVCSPETRDIISAIGKMKLHIPSSDDVTVQMADLERLYTFITRLEEENKSLKNTITEAQRRIENLNVSLDLTGTRTVKDYNKFNQVVSQRRLDEYI